MEESPHVERVHVVLGRHMSLGVCCGAVRVVVRLAVAVGGGVSRESCEGDEEGREHGGQRWEVVSGEWCCCGGATSTCE
jgi:hypothetical protein